MSFQGNYDAALRHIVALEQERDQALAMLRNAREKLVLYRQAHGGEYIGGVEFNTLIRSIDASLTPASGSGGT